MIKNYKELKVWQKSYQLWLEVYRITIRISKRRIIWTNITDEKKSLSLAI